MNILITGANGLIGKALVQKLLCKLNYDVIGLVRRSSQLKHKNYQEYIVDLTQTNLGNQIPLLNNLDVIIHLAQSAYYAEFPEKSKDIWSVNVNSTFELLEYARINKVKKFIYASSGGIYGFSKNSFSEEFKIELNADKGFYLTTKMMGELLVRNYSAYFETLILRPFFVYGPGQKKTMLFPRLIENIKTGKKIILHGNNGISINPIYVDDAVNAIKLLLETNQTGIFNISGNEILTLREIVEKISSVLNVKPLYEYSSQQTERDLIGDISKLKALGFNCFTEFDKGIKNMINTC